MNDITFAASRLADRRAEELALAVEHRRRAAERQAGLPTPARPAVRIPWLHRPRVRGISPAV